MAAIPETQVTMQDLIEWETCKADLAKLKSKEALLRNRIFSHYFPDPKEGTNSAPLAEGWLLKATYPISRKVDLGALRAATAEDGRFTLAKFDANPLVDWEPSVNMTAYRALPPDLKTMFEEALIIKPGMPQMEIMQPAAAKKAAAAKAAKAALK